MSPKKQIWIARIVGLVSLGVLLWMLFAAMPDMSNNQIRNLGVELGQRAHEAVRVERDYAYVADYSTRRYWPNREPYTSRIPREHRVYILDNEALAEFKGYTRGEL